MGNTASGAEPVVRAMEHWCRRCAAVFEDLSDVGVVSSSQAARVHTAVECLIEQLDAAPLEKLLVEDCREPDSEPASVPDSEVDGIVAEVEEFSRQLYEHVRTTERYMPGGSLWSRLSAAQQGRLYAVRELVRSAPAGMD